MTTSGHDLRAALALGTASGARTFGGWAGLAVRGRVDDGRVRSGLLLAAAGEMVGDKLSAAPPRSDPLGLGGRLVAGALAGRAVAGTRGVGAGLAGAAAGTYVSERLRATLTAHIGLPDPALGVLEDAVVVAGASVAAAPRAEEPPPGPGGPDPAREAAEPRRSRLAAAARGVLAAAAGTAAMTTAQNVVQRTTGQEPSSTPADVGRRLLRATAHEDVPRAARPAFNQAMHALYGTAWGAPLGVVVGCGPLSQRPVTLGMGFGAAVWGASLIELPLLGVSEAPWRQAPGSLLGDLAFHLVYGSATAAIYGALTA